MAAKSKKKRKGRKSSAEGTEMAKEIVTLVSTIAIAGITFVEALIDGEEQETGSKEEG